MDRIRDRILNLYPQARPDIDFVVFAEPSGDGRFDERIARWDEEALGEMPGLEALAAVDLVTPAALSAYAADRRWQVEIGGIVLGGASIATDRASQSMIAAANQLAAEEPDEPVAFKAASGWVEMSSAEVAALALAVGRHVRACFRIEREICAAIEAGAITTTAEIDQAFGQVT